MRVPKFALETIEDYYTYYVIIIGLSERVFWDEEISSVVTIAANKCAYDGWKASEKRKSIERQQRDRRRR